MGSIVHASFWGKNVREIEVGVNINLASHLSLKRKDKKVCWSQTYFYPTSYQTSIVRCYKAKVERFTLMKGFVRTIGLNSYSTINTSAVIQPLQCFLITVIVGSCRRLCRNQSVSAAIFSLVGKLSCFKHALLYCTARIRSTREPREGKY